MMVRRRSNNPFETLYARCASMVGRLSVDEADPWLEWARPFIENTADAIEKVSSFSIADTLEPAFQFVLQAKEDGDKEDRDKDDRGGNFTVLEVAQAIRKGDVSPVELVKTSLDQIESTDGLVKAWDIITAETAIAQAKQVEQALINGDTLGPLQGIPVGIKDNIFTKKIRTGGGSRLYKDFIPSYDADVVTSLKRAGAIVLGKTTTAEMALGDPPATRNPWNLAHTPGGSSSGSAAAVAADHVPFTLATQTGGSINRPAGYTGLTALKPTYDRIDRRGIFPVSWTMDHVGVMTKTAADQAVIFLITYIRRNDQPLMSYSASLKAIWA